MRDSSLKYIMDSLENCHKQLNEGAEKNSDAAYRVSAIDFDNYSSSHKIIVEDEVFENQVDAWSRFWIEAGRGYGWFGGYWEDDDAVYGSSWDQGGEFRVVRLEKWDGFDDDIRLVFTYNGNEYKTIDELAEADPIFKFAQVSHDGPWVLSEVDGVGADLEFVISDKFRTDIVQRLADKKIEELERKVKNLESSLASARAEADGDLPF